MSLAQKIFLWIGILIIIGMLLYPPFINQLNNSVGYHFLWDAPKGRDGLYTKIRYAIDYPRLFIQIGVTILIIGGLMITVIKKKVK